MSVSHSPPSDNEHSAAQLTACERRALLEDIGHVALTLGRSLLPPAEISASDVSPAVTLIPSSPTARSRPDALTSPQERLHFLSALWGEIAGALTTVARQPDSRAASVPQSMPLARSQGSSGAAASVARSPYAAAAWRHLQTTNKQFLAPHSSMQTHFPVSSYPISSYSISSFPISLAAAPAQAEQTPIVERVTTRTYDTWANRLTVSLLTRIEEEANALRRLADFCEAREEASAADHLARTARRTRANTFLQDCPGLRESEQSPGIGSDNIGRCSVPYRAIYRAWRSLSHPLDFDWSGSPLLYLPALEPWHLYEVWCYLQVAAALLCAGWHLMESDLLHCTPNGLRLGLATGRASRLCFRKNDSSASRLSLYYQPLFASANQMARRQRGQQASLESLETADNSGKHAEGDREEIGKKRDAREEKNAEFAFVSRSHAMQPDITLYCNDRLILLDPKFKRYAEAEDAQDDINKMHTYRDAIVRYSRRSGEARPSKGHSVSGMSVVEDMSPVSAAWCLFPGGAPKDTKGGTEKDKTEAVVHNPLYAYPAATPEAPFGTAGVGAFPLRPGQPDMTDSLAEFITALLAEFV